MEMPERIEVNGIWYVREDALLRERPAPIVAEAWESVMRLCKEFGVDPHRAYRAHEMGLLEARVPNGQKRPLKSRRSEFVRWMDSEMVARRA